MTETDLREQLIANKTPEDAYTLFGDPKDESLTMQRIGSEVVVYYYERGVRTNPRTFPNLAEAADYFLKELSSWFRMD